MQVIADPVILPTIRALKARPPRPAALLLYRNGSHWHDVRSQEINERLKGLAGGAFSAKEFRTWNATVLAAVTLAAPPPPKSKAGRSRAVNEAVKKVAAYLEEHSGGLPLDLHRPPRHRSFQRRPHDPGRRGAGGGSQRPR